MYQCYVDLVRICFNQKIKERGNIRLTFNLLNGILTLENCRDEIKFSRYMRTFSLRRRCQFHINY